MFFFLQFLVALLTWNLVSGTTYQCVLHSECSSPYSYDYNLLVCGRTKNGQLKIFCENNNKSNESEVAIINKRSHDSSELPNPDKGECGTQAFVFDRIVGGINAELGEFPWQALLYYRTKNGNLTYACGGVLINSRYVLTAAHCAKEEMLRRSNYILHKVVLGEFDVRFSPDCIYTKRGKSCAPQQEEFGIDSVVVHPEYKISNHKVMNDIALIKLNRKVTFTEYIRPICLPTSNETLKGNEKFSLAGWGNTMYRQSAVLLKTTLKESFSKECEEKQIKREYGWLCAGMGDGKDSCRGDSGGPLVLLQRYNGQYLHFAYGLVSYGFGTMHNKMCGKTMGAYTYIPNHINWIQQNI